MKLEITADKVKEAAAKCPQAEATLKTLFPEVFEDRYFDFGSQVKINTSPQDIPFFIGINYAPPGLEKKCLVVSDGWSIEVCKHGGYTIIIPTKK